MSRGIVWLIILGIVLTVIGGRVVFAIGSVMSPWQKTDNPTLAKAIDLPANTLPSSSNFDCTNATVRQYLAASTQPDCLVTTSFGQVGTSGIIFNGATESIPIVPGHPYFSLQPIPNNRTLMTYSSAPVVGLYLHFYETILDKITANPQNVNGRPQYTIIKPPNSSLRDASGKLLTVNINAMAFSNNGAWMVVDLPWVGFVRINTFTHDIKPFALSMQQTGDYSARSAQLAISNDGSTVAIKPNGLDQFKLYDLSDCAQISLPVTASSSVCPSRDYYAYLNSQMRGLRALYQPRFTSAAQLDITAVYEFASPNFKTAKYTLTAPGEPVLGLSYLGMGDSFASGEGAFEYITGTDTDNNKCHLSSRNYASLITAHLFAGGRSIACSGATAKDINTADDTYTGQVKDNLQRSDRSTVDVKSYKINYAPGYLAQTEFIDQYRPEVITLSIGGNDIGFADIIQRCVAPAVINTSCYASYEDRIELSRAVNGIFDKLTATYVIVSKPGKRVYVVGYPQIAKVGGNCAANVHLDSSELILASKLIDYLNWVISLAADTAGVRYVDVSDAFVGHRMCEAVGSQVAVNGLTAGTDAGIGPVRFIGNESYHPNALGHSLLESAIRTKTKDLTQPMPKATGVTQPTADATTLEAQNLPKTGRAIRAVIADGSITSDTVVRGQDITVSSDVAKVILKPLSPYTVSVGPVHDNNSGTTLYSGIATSAGSLPAAQTGIPLPRSTIVGLNVLHIYGTNMLGQPIDIYKTINVGASLDDFDGNGISDVVQTCMFVPMSGKDVDRDGIDDACDGLITELPASTTNTRQTNGVTLTGNSLQITR